MPRSTILKIIILILLLTAIVAIALHRTVPGLLGSRTSVTKFSDTSKGSLQDYYELGQSLSPRGAVATTSATFLAVGDIMLSRNVAAAIQKSGDVDLPFLKMADILKSADFNFANLESPFVEKKPIIGGHSLVFAAPKENIKGLADYNFKLLNLANNHSFDQDIPGLTFTINHLKQNNIKGIGAYFMGDVHNNIWSIYDYTWQPGIIEANGIKVAFIGASFSSINDSGKTKTPFVARIEDLDKLKTAILQAKGLADFVVVTMHAGTEYTRTPNAAQIKFAHAAIDDGADIVIGSHPHWVQTIEKYCPSTSPPLPLGEGGGDGSTNCPNPKYIFYSLGNFIFDQAWSRDTSEGLTLKITLSKSGSGNPQAPGAAKAEDLQGSRQPAKLNFIELLPIIISNSQPRPATADESEKILKKINLSTFVFYP